MWIYNEYTGEYEWSASRNPETGEVDWQPPEGEVAPDSSAGPTAGQIVHTGTAGGTGGGTDTPAEEEPPIDIQIDPTGQWHETVQTGMETAPNREAATWETPETPTVATPEQQEIRKMQIEYLERLKSQAEGTAGPSAAERTVQAERERGIRAAAALAASGRGVSAGTALRQAQEAGTAIGTGAIQEAGKLRAQEQIAARQELGQALSGVRQQDIELGIQQAQIDLKATLDAFAANVDSEALQRELNDKLLMFYTAAGISLDEAQAKIDLAIEQLKTNEELGYAQIEAGIYAAAQQATASMVGGGLVGAGSLFLGLGLLFSAFSDRKLKKDIKEADDTQVGKFVDALGSYSYKYKDDRMGKGTHYGPMADELEKSEIGKTLVVETPYGKAVNTMKAVLPLMSVVSKLDKRQKKLEKILRSKK